jgi:hypothetical protein
MAAKVHPIYTAIAITNQLLRNIYYFLDKTFLKLDKVSKGILTTVVLAIKSGTLPPGLIKY